MSKRDYYEVLGVAKSASDDEIKKAFRRKAVELHPDRGGDEEKFKEVNEAYDVLKNPSKKQRYDQFGHAGVGGASGGGQGNPFEGFSGFNQGGQRVNFDFEDLGLDDIFESFFGRRGGGQTGRKKAQKGRDVETKLELTFEQAVFGTNIDLDLDLRDFCDHCKGSTVEPGHELKTCPECKGSGQVMHVTRTIFGNIQQATVCSTCEGSGKVPEKVCSVCEGQGTARKSQTIKLKVPAGVDDGAIVRLSGQGEATANGSKGDVYVNIRVQPHKKFTREGDLILSEETIDMVDAALGTVISVDTVDGPVSMKIPAGTQNGTDFKLSGHGVPHLKKSTRGAHIVTINVSTPTKLNKKQKEVLEQFKHSGNKNFFSK